MRLLFFRSPVVPESPTPRPIEDGLRTPVPGPRPGTSPPREERPWPLRDVRHDRPEHVEPTRQRADGREGLLPPVRASSGVPGGRKDPRGLWGSVGHRWVGVSQIAERQGRIGSGREELDSSDGFKEIERPRKSDKVPMEERGPVVQCRTSAPRCTPIGVVHPVPPPYPIPGRRLRPQGGSPPS